MKEMSVHSGGILLFRSKEDRLQVLLVHPGGPFWIRKEEGAWSIPKGLFDEDESPLEAAKREFKEETGFEAEGEFIELGEQKQPSRKIVHAWALKKDLDETKVVSNRFTLEWPKKSGNIREYPEIDRAYWFNIDQARIKIQKGQLVFIDRLIGLLGRRKETDIELGEAVKKVRAEDERVGDKRTEEELRDRQKPKEASKQSQLTVRSWG